MIYWNLNISVLQWKRRIKPEIDTLDSAMNFETDALRHDEVDSTDEVIFGATEQFKVEAYNWWAFENHRSSLVTTSQYCNYLIRMWRNSTAGSTPRKFKSTRQIGCSIRSPLHAEQEHRESHGVLVGSPESSYQ
jgi:hypothetical protein